MTRPRRSGIRAFAFMFVAAGIGCILAFISLEILLRLYNPIPMPLRGREIVLPVNKTFVRRGPPANSKIDSVITTTRNSLGFRGPEPPADRDFDQALTLMTVGGSTTVCEMLSDGFDWPSLLGEALSKEFDQVWVNNAGLDGHSTFGHYVLLQQVIWERKPDYILFLVGLNDVGRNDLNEFDSHLDPASLSLRNKIVAASEALSTAQVLFRTWKAIELGLEHHWNLDFTEEDTMEIVEDAIAAVLEQHRDQFLPNYRGRLRNLVRDSRSHGSEPILVTQPALYGEGVDPTTGIHIGAIEWNGSTATEHWRVLSLYNEVTREIGLSESVRVIDLAAAMPKDSALYYDWFHYTNEGAQIVSQTLADDLIPHLRAREAKPRN